MNIVQGELTIPGALLSNSSPKFGAVYGSGLVPIATVNFQTHFLAQCSMMLASNIPNEDVSSAKGAGKATHILWNQVCLEQLIGI